MFQNIYNQSLNSWRHNHRRRRRRRCRRHRRLHSGPFNRVLSSDVHPTQHLDHPLVRPRPFANPSQASKLLMSFLIFSAHEVFEVEGREAAKGEAEAAAEDEEAAAVAPTSEEWLPGWE